MQLHEAVAICAMSRSRHEYNLGVLSLLGKSDAAAAHKLAADAVQRDTEYLGGVLATLVTPGMRADVESRLERAVVTEEQAWAPIQTLIDEACLITGAMPAKR